MKIFLPLIDLRRTHGLQKCLPRVLIRKPQLHLVKAFMHFWVVVSYSNLFHSIEASYFTRLFIKYLHSRIHICFDVEKKLGFIQMTTTKGSKWSGVEGFKNWVTLQDFLFPCPRPTQRSGCGSGRPGRRSKKRAQMERTGEPSVTEIHRGNSWKDN